MLARILSEPRQQVADVLLVVGCRSSGFVANSDKELDAHAEHFLRSRNLAFTATEMHSSLVPVFREFLEFKELHPPRLPERAALLRGYGFRFGCIDKNVASAAAAHQVQHRDREAAVPATESDSHNILLGETEIAVDFAHHVHHHLVGGMAPMHAAIQFTHRDGANALSGVVHLGVVGFQPRLELEAVEPTFHLIGQHVGDRSNSEKRVDGAGGWTTCGDA